MDLLPEIAFDCLAWLFGHKYPFDAAAVKGFPFDRIKIASAPHL
jgi:hypothetical protein